MSYTTLKDYESDYEQTLDFHGLKNGKDFLNGFMTLLNQILLNRLCQGATHYRIF